ncbi:DNA glycosylase AlkZ-like family protein [Paenibacillus sp. D51F]
MGTNIVQLSSTEARRFMLDHQGLGPAPEFGGKEGILSFISRVGCIQFDPLDQAGRNAELVLQSRIPGFSPAMLEELLYDDRLLLDGWDKVMSIYSSGDWPYFSRGRRQAHDRYADIKEIRELLPSIRQAFRDRGPLLSRDLEHKEKMDWAWAPARVSRAVMESMNLWGELIVHHKQRNQKVYDLAEKHFPEALLQAPDPNPSEQDYRKWRLMRRIGGVGLLPYRASDAWVGTLFMNTADRKRGFLELLEDGLLVQIEAEGLTAPHYVRTEDWERWSSSSPASRWSSHPPRTSVLAPLDNLLWDRRLVKELFGFHYVWEVYKPAASRLYGYYVLPVLCGDRMVARFEPSRIKGSKDRRIILGWWPEPGVEWNEEIRDSVRQGFASFRRYLGCESFELSPAALAADPELDALVNAPFR